MFKLRQQHVDALNAAAEHHFVCRMRDHAIIHFPDEAESVSIEALTERVKSQIQQARAFNITAKNDICDFISLCFTFGDQFYASPEFKWAKSILEDNVLADGSLRMNKLNHRAGQYLEEKKNR